MRRTLWARHIIHPYPNRPMDPCIGIPVRLTWPRFVRSQCFAAYLAQQSTKTKQHENLSYTELTFSTFTSPLPKYFACSTCAGPCAVHLPHMHSYITHMHTQIIYIVHIHRRHVSDCIEMDRVYTARIG